MKKQKVSISYQLKTTPTMNRLIMAYISYNRQSWDNWDNIVTEYEEVVINGIKYKSEVKPTEQNKYKPIVISTKLALPEKFWDRKDKKATGNYSQYNEQLDIIKSNIEKVFYSMVEAGIEDIQPDYFKDQIKLHVFGNKATVPLLPSSDIPTVFTEFIQFKMDEYKRLKSHEGSSINNFRKFKMKIEEFETVILNGRKLDLNEMNNNMVKHIIEWFMSKNYKSSYNDWFKARIKSFVNEAKEEDIVVDINTRKKHFKKVNEEIEDVYLTWEQLNKVKALKFDFDEKHMDMVRDLFVLNCAFGLRSSDLFSLKTINYDSDKDEWYVRTKMKKTKSFVQIPCLDMDAIKIYKKYFKTIPNNFTPKSFNENIPKIMLKAGLNHKVERDEKQDDFFYNLVSVKTCRKTFASNGVRHFKLPLGVIMQFTGHTTEAVLKKYIKLTQDEYYQIAVDALKLAKIAK